MKRFAVVTFLFIALATIGGTTARSIRERSASMSASSFPQRPSAASAARSDGSTAAPHDFPRHRRFQGPTESEWRRLCETHCATGGIGVRDDAEVLAIREKLETMKIDLDFTDSSLYDIVDFIQEFAEINIVVSADVRKEGIPEKKISFAAKDLVLKHVLRLLLLQYDLGYTFENRVLLITTPLLTEGKPVLEAHDVRDLVDGKSDAEQLEELVRRIEPESWTEREGEVSICVTGNASLLVVHVPRVHEAIRELLETLR